MLKLNSFHIRYIIMETILLIAIVVLIFWDDNSRKEEQKNIIKTEYVNILPNIISERYANELGETWLSVHFKRQLILNKKYFNDCEGENLPGSLRNLPDDLLSINGIEVCGVYAYEIVLRKGIAFTYEEVESDIRAVIENQYPFLAVVDTVKGE